MAALVPREAAVADAAKRELFGYAFAPVRLYIDKLSRHKRISLITITLSLYLNIIC